MNRLVLIFEGHTREYETPDGAQDFEGISIMMKKDDDDADDDSVVDMQKYDLLESYVRTALKIKKKDKIKIIGIVSYGGEGVMRSVIRDQSGLSSFRRTVQNLGWAKLQSAEQLVLAVCPMHKVVSELKPKTKRDGAVAQYEKDTEELRGKVYGSGKGVGRQGSFDGESETFLADHPDYLSGFADAVNVRAAASVRACPR